MQMFNWLRDILNWFGLAYKSAKILFIGLDNAGKTTLLHVLKDDRLGTHSPTVHPHSEELIIGKIKFKTLDIGGHQTARRIWKDYFTTVDALVFMVDASDTTRFPEAYEELKSLLETEELASTPFLILGNKIDKPQAVSEDELRRALGLSNIHSYKSELNKKLEGRPVELFMTSVLKKCGYPAAFEWLSQYLMSV